MSDEAEKSQSVRGHFRDIGKRIFRSEYAVLVTVIIVMGVVLSALTKGFATSPQNVKNIWVQSSVRGIASLGQFLVILTAGIDLSVGGIAIMSGNLGAALMTTQMTKNIVGYPLSPYAAIPLLLLVGAGVGATTGASVARIGMPALIVTLAMWQIMTTAAFVICRGFQILHMPPALAFAGQGVVAGIPVPIIIFFATAAVAYFVLTHTTYGRSLYAIGGNPTSAWLSGINVKQVRFSAYVICGLMAAASGVLQLSRIMASSPQMVAGLELDSIAAVCIGGASLMGGMGSVIGVVLGVLIIGTVNNSLHILAINPTYNYAVKGVIIFSAVAADFIRRRGGS